MNEELIRKLLEFAGENPQTEEQKTAYRKAYRLIQKAQNDTPVFRGYLGSKREDEVLSIKERLISLRNAVIAKFNLPFTVTIPWEKFYKEEPDDFIILMIKPSRSVRNNQAYLLAKVIAGFYVDLKERITLFKYGSAVTVKSPYRCNFRIIMKATEIGFYMIIPKEKRLEILRKIEGVYDTSITIDEIKSLPKLDPAITYCTELRYRKHPIFSLKTDKDNNYPLPSLLTAVRTLEGDDVAVFDAMLEPYNRDAWLKESATAYKMIDEGYIPNNNMGGPVFKAINDGMNLLRHELADLFTFTKEQKLRARKHFKNEKRATEIRRLKEELTKETGRKENDYVLNAWLRIAVQSNDRARAIQAANTMCNAWADIKGNNELKQTEIPSKWIPNYLDAIEQRKPLALISCPNRVSVEEAGKFIQLPGDNLLKEFPEIIKQNLREVRLPDELTQNDIPHVRIGLVTERGKTQMACIPLVAYKDEKGHQIKLSEVYDALCTDTFCQGKRGSGKSDGFGSVWSYDMVTQGFTVIMIDTADGQVLRNIINSLPNGFPDDHIHTLNFDNKAWPIAANWSDIMGRKFGADGDDELVALEISETITARFISFINSLSNTGDFTDRMKQYVESCMRAITKRATWSFLDLELALTSPSYREELLQMPEVQALPEVCFDLKTLQDKALEGKLGQIIDPILSRIKALSNTQLTANLFYQEPKLNDDGSPVLDLRKLMDNKDGGKYGHIIAIQASYDAWQDNQSTILGFFVDKINFNAFSRIDQPQEERRPVLVWIDEPHKVIKSIEGRLAGTTVEFRKYRVKNLFTGHAIEQMGAAANALLDGGAQITSYKTERLSELKRFAHAFKPYNNAEELYDALPEKWKAINSVRLPSGKPCPAFLADMVAPPAFVKDRSYVWQQSAEKYGRPWKEVRATIQSKRNKYNELDLNWHQVQEEAAISAKAAAAEALRAAKSEMKRSEEVDNLDTEKKTNKRTTKRAVNQ